MFNKEKNKNTKDKGVEAMKEKNQNIVENNETKETTVEANSFARKQTFKEKFKTFLKNKKLVGMVMEYVIITECFVIMFLLGMPAQTKATTSDIEGNNTVLSSLEEEMEENIIEETNTEEIEE